MLKYFLRFELVSIFLKIINNKNYNVNKKKYHKKNIS